MLLKAVGPQVLFYTERLLHTNADPPVTCTRCSYVDTHASAFECLHVSIRSMQPAPAVCRKQASQQSANRAAVSLASPCLSFSLSPHPLPLFFITSPPSFSPFLSLFLSVIISASSPFLSHLHSLVLHSPSFLLLHSLLPSLALLLSLLLSHHPSFPPSHALISSSPSPLSVSFSPLYFSLRFLSSVPYFPSPLLLSSSLPSLFSLLPALHRSL